MLVNHLTVYATIIQSGYRISVKNNEPYPRMRLSQLTQQCNNTHLISLLMYCLYKLRVYDKEQTYYYKYRFGYIFCGY